MEQTESQSLEINGHDNQEPLDSKKEHLKTPPEGDLPSKKVTAPASTKTRQNQGLLGNSGSEQNDSDNDSDSRLMAQQKEEEDKLLHGGADTNSSEPTGLMEDTDLSKLRGTQPPVDDSKKARGRDRNGNPHEHFRTNGGGRPQHAHFHEKKETRGSEEEEDLEALAELVPGLKTGKVGAAAVSEARSTGNILDPVTPDEAFNPVVVARQRSDGIEDGRDNGHDTVPDIPNIDSMLASASREQNDQENNAKSADNEVVQKMLKMMTVNEDGNNEDGGVGDDNGNDLDIDSDASSSVYFEQTQSPNKVPPIMSNKHNAAALRVQQAAANDVDDSSSSSDSTVARTATSGDRDRFLQERVGEKSLQQQLDKGYTSRGKGDDNEQNVEDSYDPPRYGPSADTELRMSGAASTTRDLNNDPSSASISTETHTAASQSYEVRMPMYLPTFKPATGCTNASDFIVRCFVARLRSGITVVKHGRSRWCKSRLRVLQVHSDGRSLTWKPALGEPNSNKRPPKLDLSTCMEVRHAWSPDPLNPVFTGTPILRQKCEAGNAHKSFALIFPRRTVDITAVTADQCKVLMEGFSALCFRLQVANLAGRGRKGPTEGKEDGKGDGGEDDRTTASVTLTNNSTSVSPTVGNAVASTRNSR